MVISKQDDIERRRSSGRVPGGGRAYMTTGNSVCVNVTREVCLGCVRGLLFCVWLCAGARCVSGPVRACVLSVVEIYR